jgi:hypothetical protein
MESQNEKHIADHVFDAMAEGAPRDFENPNQLPEDVVKIRAIKQVARQNIISRASEYVKTPVEERESKKHLLREIQAIVDELDDAFVLMVPQKDGAPYSITFNPRTPEKESPRDPLADIRA